MKKSRMTKWLMSCLLLISINSFSQFTVVELPPYCSGQNVTVKIDNIFDFYTNITVGNGYEPYIEFTTVGPAYETSVGIHEVANYLSGGSNELTEEYLILNTDEWYSTTDVTLIIKGYESNDGGTTLDEVTNALQQIVIPARMTFPTLTGPSVITSPSPVQYAITPITEQLTFNWSIPNGWSIDQNTGETITVTPGGQGGNVTLTTSPPVLACNYPPPSIPITIDPCYLNGYTEHSFCGIYPWSGDFLNYSTNNSPNPNQAFYKTIGDFDGDGNDDVVGFKNRVDVALSSGSNFSSSTWTTSFCDPGVSQTNYPRMVGDFNGDDKDDILIFGYDVTAVGISTGYSFPSSLFSQFQGFSYSVGYTDRNVVQRMIGDFNGDNKDDIVGFGYTSHAVALSSGTSFSTAGWTGGPEMSSEPPYSMNSMNYYPKMVGDFNGDDMDDVIGFAYSGVNVGISTGSKFNFSTWTTDLTYGNDGFIQSEHPRYIGDFNGDGFDDIIGFGESEVIVGISDGVQGFTTSVWMVDQFTTSVGWGVDAREYGVGGALPDPNQHIIRIADANGDGLDDIIGFTGDGVWISYSTGWKFLCPDQSGQYAGGLYDVGDFDNTDDAVELMGTGTYYTGVGISSVKKIVVMDCAACDTPVAEAQAMNFSGTHLETGMWEIDIYDYCSNDVKLDVSQSSCEAGYFFEVHEFDINTFASTNMVYSSNWIYGASPNEIDVSAVFNFQPNTLYMITYGVGFQVATDNVWLRMKEPTSSFSLNSNESRWYSTKGTHPTEIHGFCQDVNRFGMDASTSSCYDEYRYELREVNGSLIPYPGSIVQVPYGGGWNSGPAPSITEISTNYIPPGSIYRIELETKNAFGTASSWKFLETTDCVVGDEASKNLSASSTIKDEKVVVFPNPTSRDEIFIKTTEFGFAGAQANIYSVEGKLLKSVHIDSNTTNKVDLQGFAPGTYNLVITTDGHVETHRFIAQ